MLPKSIFGLSLQFVCTRITHTTGWRERHWAIYASSILYYAAGIWKRRFHSENASNVFRPHYAGGIWKQRFHSENASNIFRPHYVGGIWNRGFTLKTHQIFSVHTTPEEFETEVSLWKRIRCFPSTLNGRNLKQRLHSENASNVFRPHYAGGNLKTEVSLWKRIKYFPSTLRGRNLKQRFHSENASNVFRPHYAGGIWNRGFTLKTHQIFSVHTTPEEFENATITGHFYRSGKSRDLKPSLSKAPFFKCFPHARLKRKAGAFKILPVRTAF